MVFSVGTLPVNATLPSCIGICPETNAKFPDITTGMYEPAGFGGIGSVMPSDFNFSSITKISFCLGFLIL
jgi:hypothetical protein